MKKPAIQHNQLHCFTTNTSLPPGHRVLVCGAGRPAPSNEPSGLPLSRELRAATQETYS
jgi:hypothetical protein